VVSDIIASCYPFPFTIGHGHDVNCSLLAGDRIYSYEEAKISQVMHDSCSRFPERALFLGLRQFGIAPRDVMHWVWGVPNQVNVAAALEFFYSLMKCESYQALSEQGRVHFVSHHKAHAYLAIMTSPFADGCFLTLDGGGDEAQYTDSTWGVFEDRRIVSSESSKGGHGLTLFHGYVCELVGYLNFADHGKLMGLASYAEPPEELCKELRRYLVADHDGMNFRLSLERPGQSTVSAKRIRIDAYDQYKTLHQPNPPAELVELTKFYPAHQVAAAGQRVFEDCLCEIAATLVRRTGKKNLVLCGGAFHNVCANRRIHELGCANVFVPMGVGDEGVSLGAAFSLLAEKKGASSSAYSYLTPFLGPQFSDEEVRRLVQEYGLLCRHFESEEEQCRFVARSLADGQIVGWFQGRAELGPRALGARSVLADPRALKSKARLNQLLKRRDWFMPFAPAVLEGYEEAYLESYTRSPYMTMAFRATEKAKREIPAGIHVDGTCRPNCVSRATNRKFYRLIEEFMALAGVPAVLNTSFNRHGIPTIASPRQAFEHLAEGAVDLLAIERFVVFPSPGREAQPGVILDERVFLAFESIKPILKAWARGDEVREAVRRCEPEIVRGLGLEWTAGELRFLGHVFRREQVGESAEELLQACRGALEAQAGLVAGLSAGPLRR
jgi:carbamoyltransferase